MMSHNPISYIGSKAALAPTLLPLLAPHGTYVEVFGGAAHLLCRKPRVGIEVYNDVDARLVNLFRVLRDRFDDLAARLRWTLYSRSIHTAWRKAAGSGDPVDEALQTYYLLRSSMVGDITGPWAHSRQRDHARGYERSKAMLVEVAQRFLAVAIEQLDFRILIPRWDSPSTLFFCDPPYYGTAGSQFWPFTEQDHADLAASLHAIQGKALVTYYDCPEVRSLYPGWHCLEHTRPRRGANFFGHAATTVTEIILTNYPLPPPDPTA